MPATRQQHSSSSSCNAHRGILQSKMGRSLLARDSFEVERLDRMIKAIFFDAAGTLFYLTKTVGEHYALVGREVGLDLDAQTLDRAFRAAWKQMPQRAAIDGPRENDDKGWWRELVDFVLDQVAP